MQLFKVSTRFLMVFFSLAASLILATPPFALHSAAMTASVVNLSGQAVVQSSIAYADFDGDADLELVIGGQDGRLYVLAYNASTWSVVWSRQTADDLNAAGANQTSCAEKSISDIRSAPTIADLDADGDLEIIVTTGGDPAQQRNGGVLVYTYHTGQAWANAFSVMPGWPQPKLDIVGLGPGASNPDNCWDGIWGSAAVGDVDGDGDLEVAVEGFDRRLHLWHHTGAYVTGWPIAPPTISRGGWATPAMADLDKDGRAEIVFATDYVVNGNYHLFAYNGDATLLPGFPVYAEQNMQSSPAIGDLDGDGWLDIVVGTGTYTANVGKRVYAWNHLGQPLSGWPRTTDGRMPASPALADLDNDGDLEVIIGCGSEGDPYDPPACTKLYAWHGDGSAVSGFPMVPPANNSWTSTSIGLPNSPIVADYNGDGNQEILVVTRWAWGISTVTSAGVAANDPALRTQGSLYSSPAVADFDNDGFLEIAIAGVNASSNGAVYIWDASGPAKSQALPWPTFHHDVARTGRYALPPELVFADELRFLHQTGSGNTVTGYTWVQNGGEGEFEWAIEHTIPRFQTVPVSGTVATAAPIQMLIDVSGLADGWHNLGNVTVTGFENGVAVSGSPKTVPLYIYVGEVFEVHLPLVLRLH